MDEKRTIMEIELSLTRIAIYATLIILVAVAINTHHYNKKMKKITKLMQDTNIDWSQGGICLKKKNYPENEVKDNFRESSGKRLTDEELAELERELEEMHVFNNTKGR